MNASRFFCYCKWNPPQNGDNGEKREANVLPQISQTRGLIEAWTRPEIPMHIESPQGDLTESPINTQKHKQVL